MAKASTHRRSILEAVGVAGGLLMSVLSYSQGQANQKREIHQAHEQLQVAQQQVQVARQQASDLRAAATDTQFQHAMGKLAAVDPVSRAGALLALRDLAQSNPKLVSTAILGIAASLHNWTRTPSAGLRPVDTDLPTEVQDAKNVLRILLKAATQHGRVPQIDLSHVDLHGVSWGYVRLSGVYAVGIDLQAANLSDARMQGATISYGHFECANLARAKLAGAHLEHASFAGANLAGADFTGASGISSASLSGASWDSKTLGLGLSANQPPYQQGECLRRLAQAYASPLPDRSPPSSPNLTPFPRGGNPFPPPSPS